MKVLILIVMSLVTSSAMATGGTYCSVDTEDVRLEVSLLNGRVFGSPIVPGSTVRVEFKKATHSGVNSYTFQSRPNQSEIPYWYNFNYELKMGAYAELESDFQGKKLEDWHSLAVVVDAKWKSTQLGGHYVGVFEVVQSSNSNFKGSYRTTYQGFIECEAE